MKVFWVLSRRKKRVRKAAEKRPRRRRVDVLKGDLECVGMGWGRK